MRLSKFFGSEKGFTLAEIMISTAIGVTLLSAISGQMYALLGISRTITDQEQLQRLVTKNVTEIESLPYSEIPDAGSCKIITYNNFGMQLSSVDTVGDTCLATNLQPGELSVVWLVSGQESIDATFSHPNYLKIPANSNKIKKIVLRSSSRELQGDSIKTFFITLFKS